MDMLDGVRIPNCPSQFKVIAENIMNMAMKPGYSVGDYNTMTELDKILMLDYWSEYDGFMDATYEVMYPSREQAYQSSRNWFIKKATAPELIRRARQYLTERNYLLIKDSVAQHAYQAGEKFSRAIKQ
jgi:hypothetical protein